MKEREKIVKYYLQSYRNHAYMHSYCSIFVNIHNFASTNMGVFLVKIYKIHTFLHFEKIDIVALKDTN